MTATAPAGSTADCAAACVRSMVFRASAPAPEVMPRATASAIFFEVPVGEKTTVQTVSGFMALGVDVG